MSNNYVGSSRKIPTNPSNPGGWSNSRPGSHSSYNSNKPKWYFSDYCEVKISSKNADIYYKGYKPKEHVEQLLPAHKQMVSDCLLSGIIGIAVGEGIKRTWPFCKVILKVIAKNLSKTKKSEEKQEDANTKELGTVATMEDILSDTSIEMTEDMPLLGEIITAGDTIMLYSSDGVGKSLGSMQICIDLANGWKSTLLPNAEDYPIPSKHQVFSYDLENKKKDLKKRYKDAGMTVPQNLHIIKMVFKTVSDFLADVEKRVIECSTDVIVNVDNICSQFGSLSKSESWNLKQGLNTIKDKFLKEKGHLLTVILVNHSVKSHNGESNQQYAGSADLARHCDLRVFLSPTRFGNQIIMMDVEKNRNHENDDMVYILHRVKKPYLHFEYIGKAWKHDVRPNRNTKSGDIIIYEPSDYFDFTTLRLPPSLNLRFSDANDQQEEGEEFIETEEPKISDKDRFIQQRREGVARLFSTGITDQEIADKLTVELGKSVSKDDVRNDRKKLKLKKQ